MGSNSNPLADFVENSLKNQDSQSELRTKVEELAVFALEQAMVDYQHGDTTTKSYMNKTILGPIIRGLGMDDDEAALDKARREFVSVLAECVGVGIDDDEEVEDEDNDIEAIADEHDDYEETS